MHDGFRYSAEDHSYWLGERRLPSVTEVLKVLPNGYEHVSPEVLERKRVLGTAVHLACELDDRGTLDESTLDPAIQPYLSAWRRFRADTGFRCTVIEKSGYSRQYGYAGTLDRLGEIASAVSVVDLKCVAELKPETGLQLAAYSQLVLEMGVIDRARRFTLPLPRVLYRVYRGGGRAVRSRA